MCCLETTIYMYTVNVKKYKIYFKKIIHYTSILKNNNNLMEHLHFLLNMAYLQMPDWKYRIILLIFNIYILLAINKHLGPRIV